MPQNNVLLEIQIQGKKNQYRTVTNTNSRRVVYSLKKIHEAQCLSYMLAVLMNLRQKIDQGYVPKDVNKIEVNCSCKRSSEEEKDNGNEEI